MIPSVSHIFNDNICAAPTAVIIKKQSMKAINSISKFKSNFRELLINV